MYSCLICGIKSEAEYVITHHRCTYADMKKLHEDQNRKRDRMTWTPEQQERVLQLIDYCTEMTSGYLSGWAKSLMADLKGDGLNVIERQILKDGVAAMNMGSATLHYPSLEDRQHEEIINLLEKILLDVRNV